MPLCGLLKRSWYEFCVDYGFFTDPPSARYFTTYGCDDLEFGRDIVNHVHYNSLLNLSLSLYDKHDDDDYDDDGSWYECIRIWSCSNVLWRDNALNDCFIGRLDDANTISMAACFMDRIFASKSPVITVNKILHDHGLAVLFDADRYAPKYRFRSPSGTVFKAFDYNYYLRSRGFGVRYMYDGDDAFVCFGLNKLCNDDGEESKLKLDSYCDGAVRDIAEYYRERLY